MRPPLPALLVVLSVLLSPVLCNNYRARGCDGSTGRGKLYIQGFVPASGDVFTSETVVPASTIACREINQNSSILTDYELVIEWSDTKCDASEATWQLIQVVLDNNGTQQDPRIMFLGGGCSPATEPLAALSGRFYNVTQVSYGASTPTLSSRQMFPSFFRTIPSEVQGNSARFALMKRFDWERVATLHETRNIFSATVNDFRDEYRRIYGDPETDEDDDDDLVVRSFTDDPEIPLRQIHDKDIRIILAYMYEDKARYTICQAIQLNLTTENHLWMFPAWFTTNWWNQTVNTSSGVTCSPNSMREAVMYSLFLDSYNETLDGGSADSDLSTSDFQKEYMLELAEFNQTALYRGDDDLHHYATFAYDAVWTMALALNRTDVELQKNGLSLLNFSYSNELNITGRILEHMRTPNFRGISGDIVFDENGTRIGQNGIYQLVPDGDRALKLELLYVQDPNDQPQLPEDFSEWIRRPGWKGDGPPRDRRQPDTKYLNKDLIAACDFFISVAILVAAGLLVFNLAMIWKPLIRDSAPIINAIIIGGCILLLVACYMLGVDTQFPQQGNDDPNKADEENVAEMNTEINDRRDHRYGVICNLRLWFFTLGFSLSFGALFAKTWQVYRVYTNPKLKKEPFKMWNFLIILAVFLGIDVVYLSIWTGWFQFRRALSEIENNDRDTLEVYETCECDNFNYLIGALYVYKGLLVVFGLFLAYESRNVKYYYINDSRFTSIAMYIVVIVVGIGAPLSLVLSEHLFIDPAYALTVLMVIMATMSCLLILFVPKFVYLAKGRDTMVNENTREEVTAGDGLQLGHTSVDQSEMQCAEDEVRQLQEKVEQKTSELHTLEDTLSPPTSDPTPTKSRNGSDGDSGVLVTTTDEQPEMFVSDGGEAASGARERRPSSTTTSSTSPNLNGETTDEGL